MALDFIPQVLIVDDHIENLELLSALLAKLKLELILSQSPIKVLQDIEEKEYALIILDVQMPQMDGFLLAQKIRSSILNKSTPIIFLTAIYLDKESEVKAYKCGGVDFIMKPFDAAILLNKVNIFLDLYSNKRLLELQNKKLTVALNEKNLLESHLRNLASDYRSILEGQSELILKMDSEQRLVFANKAFTDFFDYTIDGIVKDRLLIISNVLQEHIAKRIASLNGKNRVIVFEESFVNSKGNQVFLEWTIYKEVAFDDTFFLAVGRDVSDRKSITESLLKKENVLRKIQKKTNIGIFEWDSSSKEMRGSEEFLKLYELSEDAEQSLLNQIKSNLYIEERNAIESFLLDLPKENQKIEFKHAYKCKNGTCQQFKVEMYNEYDAVINRLKLFGFVSEYLQEEVLESPLKGSLILNNETYINKAIYELDEHQQLCYLNNYACDVLECTVLNDYKGIDFKQFFEDVPKLEKVLETAHLKNRFVFEVFSVLTKKNKRKSVVLAAHSIVRDNKKGIRGVMMEIHNNACDGEDASEFKNIITGLKRQEKEFEEKTKKLKQKVEKELKQNDIHRELLLKKSELESLGKVASTMVNEINQPLSGISMVMDNLLQRLSKHKIDEDYIREKSVQIFSDVDRIKNYLSQIGIYNYSQKESVEALIDVNSILKLSLSIVQKQFKNSNITWIFDEAKYDLFVIGNKYKLQKVLVDILNNSFESLEQKFKNEKSGNRQISITSKLNGYHVIITIKDNGCGISSDSIKHIFEPFFTTKQNELDSDLGLYVSKDIVEKMNGQILVNSKKGAYTEMTIILPYEFKRNKQELNCIENYK